MRATQLRPPSSIVNRTPVYYGWVVWLVAAVGMSATMPGQTANVSLFIDRWIADFGLENRTQISALYGIGTFIASLTLTFVGNRIDKHGTRFMGVVIVLLFAAALLYMSFVSNLAMLLVGFILIRGLGQGSLFIVSSTSVANWFQRMRGRVLAFALITFSLFQRWYIPTIQSLLEDIAWQRVWLILAVALLVIVVPAIALFMRETPERYGLLPDGDSSDEPDPTNENEPLAPLEINYTLREATRLPIFWVFVIGGMMTPAFVTGILFHQESLFGIAGYDPTTSAVWVSNGLVLASFSMLVTGFLVDRVRPSFARALELVALALLMVLSAFLDAGQWALYGWAILLGTVNGVGGVFNSAVYVNFFGRRHQGEIRGFISMLGVTGTAIGPFLLALSYDEFGTYTASLLIGAGIVLIPMIAALFMTKPRSKTQEPAA